MLNSRKKKKNLRFQFLFSALEGLQVCGNEKEKLQCHIKIVISVSVIALFIYFYTRRNTNAHLQICPNIWFFLETACRIISSVFLIIILSRLPQEYMVYRKHTYMRLDGSSKISERRDMVADFQSRWVMIDMIYAVCLWVWVRAGNQTPPLLAGN